MGATGALLVLEVRSVPDSGTHSAAGQALGYFHQCMRALAELGRRGALEPTVEMRIEMLDDIDFSYGGSPTELLQMKHHLDPGTVTMNSVDLWRSLNVWMDLDINEKPALRWLRHKTPNDGLALLGSGAGRGQGRPGRQMEADIVMAALGVTSGRRADVAAAARVSGLSMDAAKQRCSRAKRRLVEAVRAELRDDATALTRAS